MSTASTDQSTSLVDDVPATADITTYTTATGAYAVEITIDGVVSTTTSLGEIPITNAAQFSSIASIESESAASASTSTQNPADSSSSTANASSTAGAGGSSSSTPIGPIVGGVIGGICVAVLVAIVVLFTMRRRHHAKRAGHAQIGDGHQAPFEKAGHAQMGDGHQASFEKAQLHGNDIKPNNELEGDTPSARFLQKRPVVVAELPANEDVSTRRNRSSERNASKMTDSVF